MNLAMWKLVMLTEGMAEEKSEKKTENTFFSPFDKELKEQIEGLIAKAKAIQSI